MNEFSGYVLALSSLWSCTTSDEEDTRSVILTVINHFKALETNFFLTKTFFPRLYLIACESLIAQPPSRLIAFLVLA